MVAALAGRAVLRPRPALPGFVWPYPDRRDPMTPADAGMSIRFIRQFDAETLRPMQRIDVLYGMGCIAPGTIVRMAS